MTMLSKSNKMTRSKQRSSTRLLRGVYGDESDDTLSAYFLRYPSAVLTLDSALSLYGIIDEWLTPPYFLSFALGYRPIKDSSIVQLWDNNELRLLGTVRIERDGIPFLCHDIERLLIELWRREKRLSREIMAKAVFWYREKANSGELNLPKLREYISKMPKGKIYAERLRKEIL